MKKKINSLLIAGICIAIMFSISHISSLIATALNINSYIGINTIDISLKIVTYTLLLLLFAKKEKQNPFRKISIDNSIKIMNCGLITNLVSAIILTLTMSLFSNNNVSEFTTATSAATSSFSIGNMLFILLIGGIIAPIVEEITFRYGCQRALKKGFSVKIAIILQAIMFGVAHGNLIQGIYAGLSSLLLGYMYEKSNENLLVPILFHITFNSSTIITSTIHNMFIL